MFANVFGPDGLILIALIIVLFGGASQLPKLARSLGSAKYEFEQGQRQAKVDANQDKPVK